MTWSAGHLIRGSDLDVAMGIIDTAGRLLPSRLKRRVAPLAARLDGLLGARGERTAAQRMPLMIRVASAVIALLSQVVLARFLGTFEYGIYVFVWTLALIVGRLACLGFDSAVIRFLPQYRAADAHAEIR
ncbi:MAG TPA: oligosaccharide flippase family protein, partial [Pararhizobium sp.]|nr:oligosaccharide flippase family protein [Pararhizobium sp.]